MRGPLQNVKGKASLEALAQPVASRQSKVAGDRGMTLYRRQTPTNKTNRMEGYVQFFDSRFIVGFLCWGKSTLQRNHPLIPPPRLPFEPSVAEQPLNMKALGILHGRLHPTMANVSRMA